MVTNVSDRRDGRCGGTGDVGHPLVANVYDHLSKSCFFLLYFVKALAVPVLSRCILHPYTSYLSSSST